MSVKEIYFDNSATTRQYDEVTLQMKHIAENVYGNPSSLHTKGIEAERIITAARDTVAGSLSAARKEIIFTSGGTESNNLAIRGYLAANPRKGKHIITTAVEHPSVLETFRHMGENGYDVDYIGVDGNGYIKLDELESKLRKDTALISIVLVNNETGAIQDIEKIVRLKKASGSTAVIHTDAVQAYGKMLINPAKAGIDMLSASAHKIHGPKGVGFLYVSGNIRIRPILFGGGQEALLRSGTENVPGIGGFGLAAEKKFSRLLEDELKVKGIKAAFLNSLRQCSFDYKVISPVNSSPYILNIAFPGVRSEVLLHHLEEKKVYVSSGSACSAHKKSKSHVLKAMCLPDEEVDSAIRFSFSADNCAEEAGITVEILKELVPRIQAKKPGKR